MLAQVTRKLFNCHCGSCPQIQVTLKLKRNIFAEASWVKGNAKGHDVCERNLHGKIAARKDAIGSNAPVRRRYAKTNESDGRDSPVQTKKTRRISTTCTCWRSRKTGYYPAAGATARTLELADTSSDAQHHLAGGQRSKPLRLRAEDRYSIPTALMTSARVDVDLYEAAKGCDRGVLNSRIGTCKHTRRLIQGSRLLFDVVKDPACNTWSSAAW
ncbi:hypothetical protein CERZMDRAFT_80150 [Cercospora zeae-maydis SCOH1-5]|uniref:Uncharacterized protein n=1 Tax=Cercospora zeae-maydis SCOH1-5 TaxID=717836 RepID=A0A6A6FVK7_9PEZI|nr:hypothetical protein CERZMDRAFT_80150 [Cercospora zeae-maydis SCOH1-5]